MIKVFGHKSPDTDATCAPLAFAWYLNQKGIESEAFILGELNKETKFVVDTFNFNTPDLLKLEDSDEVAILDTNNPEELPENLSSAKILNIIDHHKLSGLKTDSPLQMIIKPVGCTSTIVYQIMTSDSVSPSKEIAGILLSAILSDTLNFTSPTTTEEDKDAADKLKKIAEIDIASHATAMFEAKSDLTGMSSRDILMMDSKVFDFNNKLVRISTLETTNPENAKSMINDIKKELEEVKTEENLYSAYFFIIDIINSSAEMITTKGAEEDAQKAFNKDFDNGFMILPGVVSRKKQIAPSIEKALS